MTKEMMYDPPTGWRYGFPKVYRPIEGETIEDTLARDGYPRKMADDFGGKHCRFWYVSEESTQNSDTTARLAVEGFSLDSVNIDKCGRNPVESLVVTRPPAPASMRANDRPAVSGAWTDGGEMGGTECVIPMPTGWRIPASRMTTFIGEVPFVAVPGNDNVHVAVQPERKGDWMQTFTGRQFWPMDPRAAEVEIEDIAHALSMQCRYAGHCKRFYSVAEHSVLLARHVSPENALWALLHDASEAYLVDVPRPVKPFLTGYKAAEGRVMAAVCDRFELPPEMPTAVHEADGRIIANERANMATCVAPWSGYDDPLPGVELEYWAPEVAELYFLDTFRKLTRVRQEAKRRVA